MLHNYSNNQNNDSNRRGYIGQSQGTRYQNNHKTTAGIQQNGRMGIENSRINPEHKKIKDGLSDLHGRCTQLIRKEVRVELNMGAEQTGSPVLKLVSLRADIAKLEDSPPAQVNPGSLKHFDAKISKFEAPGIRAPFPFNKRSI